MRRLAVLLAIAGCDVPAETAAPPRRWVGTPGLSAWPLGVVSGTIGRSQPPQHVLDEGVTGVLDPVGPLRLPTVWAVPGDGPARAIVYGTVGGTQAVDLVEIDTGLVRWRDTAGCAGPVVGVTDEVTVCADGNGTRALGLDGKKRWNTDGATFIAMTGERIVIAGAGEAVIVDANTGDELARVKMPNVAMVPRPQPVPARGPRGAPRASAPSTMTITSDSIVASCGDAGRELFAYGQDGRLVRIAEAAGGPKATWAVALDTIAGIDACDGDSVLVTVSTNTGTALVSLARETGAVRGTITDVRGYWPARDGSARIEVSTTGGIARWSRELVAPSEYVAGVPSLGELLAKRGQMRLVRATPLTAALLDSKGVRSYLPLAQLGAALGDNAILTGSWLGSPGETVHRISIPTKYKRVLRVPQPRPGVALPDAELRDLPELVDIDGGGAVTRPDTAKRAVAAISLDAYEPHVVYAAALDHDPDRNETSSLARFDLRARTWSWSRAEGCGHGVPVGVAVARSVVVCASRGVPSSVRATARDGSSERWEWIDRNIDRVVAAGDVVLAFDAGRMTALDANDGHVLASFSSDDGAAMRAAVLDVAGMTMVVTAERGRVIGRLPRAQMAPAWSLAIEGVVADLSASGDGVLVALEDGDAYRVDARTGTTVPIPGLDLLWRATGELVTGETAGGPIPPEGPWLPLPPKVVPRRGPPPERDPEGPPTLPKTWPAPPPMRASWQYTLYELSGGLRVRNDYALAEPITPAPARIASAPLVVQSGPGQREVLVLDPDRGDPLRRVRLPESAAPGMAFSTIVDGKPVVGTLLANPLRVVLF